MSRRGLWFAGLFACPLAGGALIAGVSLADATDNFLTADRCVACHKGVAAEDGTDVSIGFDWRASMMANAARDPYFHAAVRREIMDHPEAAVPPSRASARAAICRWPPWPRCRTGARGRSSPTSPSGTRTARTPVSQPTASPVRSAIRSSPTDSAPRPRSRHVSRSPPRRRPTGRPDLRPLRARRGRRRHHAFGDRLPPHAWANMSPRRGSVRRATP